MTEHDDTTQPTPFLRPAPPTPPVAAPATHTTAPDRNAAMEAAAALEEVLHETKRVIVGQDAMLERVLVALLAGGHVLLEGVPGLAKTLTVKTLAPRARRHVQPRAVHAGPRPGRPRRHARLAPGHRHVRHRARPGLRQPAARRRDQPRAREGAVGAARGHAGAAGDDRRRDLPRPVAVPRARHAEPDRVRGHVPAARGPGRPLPAEDPRRLPEPRGRVGGRRARHRGRARGAAGARGGRAARSIARPFARSPSSAATSPTPSRWPTPRGTRRSTASATSRAGSRSARARAVRSAWCRPPRRSRCCAVAAT